MSDRELAEKWKNGECSTEEYFELQRRLPSLDHDIKCFMFRQRISDAMREDLISIMVAEGTMRSPWERRLTMLALFLGLAGSLSAIAQFFQAHPSASEHPTIIRELVLHTTDNLNAFESVRLDLDSCGVSNE